VAGPAGGDGAATRLQAEAIDALATTPPGELFERLGRLAGAAPGELPSDMRAVNNLLDALPASLRDGLLVEFVKRLYVPS
jgi:hypothetical protein